MSRHTQLAVVLASLFAVTGAYGAIGDTTPGGSNEIRQRAASHESESRGPPSAAEQVCRDAANTFSEMSEKWRQIHSELLPMMVEVGEQFVREVEPAMKRLAPEMQKLADRMREMAESLQEQRSENAPRR